MIVTTPDPYAVLGVHPSVPGTDIDSAYQRAMKRAHPDRGGDPAEARRINDAYDLLRDPERRARHDAETAAAQTPAREPLYATATRAPHGGPRDGAGHPRAGGSTLADGSPNPDHYARAEVPNNDGYLDAVARAGAKTALTASTIFLTVLWWGAGIVVGVVALIIIVLITDHEQSRAIAPLATPVFVVAGAGWFALPLVIIFRQLRRQV